MVEENRGDPKFFFFSRTWGALKGQKEGWGVLFNESKKLSFAIS